jgi:hypothetical protein
MAAQLGGGTVLGWARREILGDGRSLPTVLARLAEAGLAATLMTRIDAVDVSRMAAALAASHGLPAAPPPLSTWSRPAAPPKAGSARIATPMPPDDTHVDRPVPRADPASHTAVAATAASLCAAGNDLAALPPATAALLLAAIHLDVAPGAPRAALVAIAAAIVAHRASDRQPHDIANALPLVAAPAAQGAPTAPRMAAAPSPALPATGPATAAPSAVPEQAAAALPGFATDFAGLFFLLNAFLALGLYPDFTRPADKGLAIAPSRLLDRLAATWFGPRYRADRLHQALAAATADPPLPGDWQTGAGWLMAFDQGGIAATRLSARHITHWHADGFVLLDRRRRARLGRHQPLAQSRRVQATRRLPAAASERWLTCLGLYLDARIRRACGDPSLGLASLALPGHCRIAAGRIDVTLALADLPVQLRLAGLDRDPGWLPAEGRAVALHFQ